MFDKKHYKKELPSNADNNSFPIINNIKTNRLIQFKIAEIKKDELINDENKILAKLIYYRKSNPDKSFIEINITPTKSMLNEENCYNDKVKTDIKESDIRYVNDQIQRNINTINEWLNQNKELVRKEQEQIEQEIFKLDINISKKTWQIFSNHNRKISNMNCDKKLDKEMKIEMETKTQIECKEEIKKIELVRENIIKRIKEHYPLVKDYQSKKDEKKTLQNLLNDIKSSPEEKIDYLHYVLSNENDFIDKTLAMAIEKKYNRFCLIIAFTPDFNKHQKWRVEEITNIMSGKISNLIKELATKYNENNNQNNNQNLNPDQELIKYKTIYFTKQKIIKIDGNIQNHQRQFSNDFDDLVFDIGNEEDFVNFNLDKSDTSFVLTSKSEIGNHPPKLDMVNNSSSDSYQSQSSDTTTSNKTFVTFASQISTESSNTNTKNEGNTKNTNNR